MVVELRGAGYGGIVGVVQEIWELMGSGECGGELVEEGGEVECYSVGFTEEWGEGAGQE